MVEPQFVDFYGTGRGPSGPPEPFWKAAWKGREPLWKAFWGAFVFGHGLLTAFGIGAMIFAGLFGLVARPSEFAIATFSVGIGAIFVVGVALPYLVWASVAVWRCAFNVGDRNWGLWARGAVVVYWAFAAYLLAKGLLAGA